jgi:hypothetical protein
MHSRSTSDPPDAEPLPPTARDHAAAASLQIIEQNGGTPPADQSLCIPATDTDPRCLRRFGYASLLRLIVGVLSMVAAGLLFAYATFQGNFVLDLLAFPMFVGGLLLLLSNVFFQRRLVRRQIGSRYDDIASWDSSPGPFCVGIEDASTFHRMKVFPEDYGYLALDPSRALMVIEGIRYRYIVFGKDVSGIHQIAGATNTATAIEYAIGKGRLRIAVEYVSIWHEIKRTFGASQDALIVRIRATLERD